MKNNQHNKKGDENDMNAMIPEKSFKLDPKVAEKIRKSSDALTVKDGIIILDRNNAMHREWYENDEDYDI